MAKKIFNIGTVAKDGTGTDLRTTGGYLNDNFTELYNHANRMYDINAFVVSDTDDLCAHESQILCHRLTDKTVLLVLYCSDKVTETERALTAHCTLKIFELTTKTLLKTIDLFYPGLVAGLTQPADEPQTAPRMYVSGTTLRCFIGVETALYNRDIDISNTDPSTWTAGNLVIEQMTMKDAGGSDVTVNVTPANIQAHLEYILGETNVLYNDLAPWFRNLDRITVDANGDWYSILELSNELGAGTTNMAMLVKSIDDGASWTFHSLVGYTTTARTRILEASVVLIGTTFHVINRTGGNTINHYYSINDGATWVNAGAIGLSTLGSKPTAINYYKADGSTKSVMVAVSLTSEVTGNTYRTTLGIYTTDDFVSFIEVAKIVTPSYAHYPSLCHFSRSLYLSYSKGMKFNTDGDAVTTSNRNTIVVTRIY